MQQVEDCKKSLEELLTHTLLEMKRHKDILEGVEMSKGRPERECPRGGPWEKAKELVKELRPVIDPRLADIKAKMTRLRDLLQTGRED